MLFRQVTHDDLGCASYLIGDEDAGVAAVVDPKLHIEEYLRLARYLGVGIDHVLETHTHADHVSGHAALAEATGAVIHIHRDSGAGYDHDPFDDGWELELGRVRVRAVHTPGHRPEHTAFALIDAARGPQPWAVLTGDTLFVGDVARPDLAVDKEDGARAMFHSLHERLLSLAPETEVWPAHLGGSLCGGPGMDLKVSSTIGYERDHNDLLQVTDEERFVEQAIATLGPQPPNFKRIVELNRDATPVGEPDVHPLTPRQVQRKADEGALLVDVRTDVQFDEAHVPGAVALTMLRAGFGSKLAWVVGPEQELVLIGRGDDDARDAATLAAAVGVTRIAGALHGGMTSWRQEGRTVQCIERITVPDLHERRDDVQILDVRERSEWDAGHIPGSTHAPYHDLHEPPGGLHRERPVAAICATGQRAAVAASLLQRHGFAEVLHVVQGGVPRWGREGYGLED